MTRRPTRLAAFAASILGSIAACGPATSTAAVPRQFYGVVPQGSLDAGDYARMAAARAGALRFQMFWPTIQSSQLDADLGIFDWTAPDAFVAGAVGAGLKPLPVLFGTPSFETGCSTRACQVTLPVDSAQQRSDWEAFVRAAAQRYGPTGLNPLDGAFWTLHPGLPYEPIRYWQIWNEQNNIRIHASPGHYATAVKLAHGALTGVDPGAHLTLGGMYGTPHGSTRTADTSWGFLAGLYKAGLKPYFDAIALHPYAPSVAGITSQIKKIRKVRKRHRDGGTPIVLTELGWGSDREHTKGERLVKTPRQQRRLLTSSVRVLRANRAKWGIGAIYWFSWKDPPKEVAGDLCGFCGSTGLYKSDGTTPKPALGAFEKFTSTAK